MARKYRNMWVDKKVYRSVGQYLHVSRETQMLIIREAGAYEVFKYPCV